ncbi:hypothetical protein [Asanoa iriomotensis]|uniref:Uncharacterized protein n=1 Tax=Asanoa iriomotensis TaxID=234613 RepID=A0ABQ4BU51_9ACTN|nr:hypothetical protein [Asanoa iriomotensis]GIF54054.1 hypothetical protein Air01nite_01490 [Asanoa iriomotensis]
MTEPEESREKAPKTDAVLFKGDEKDIDDMKREEEEDDLKKEEARRRERRTRD